MKATDRIHRHDIKPGNLPIPKDRGYLDPGQTPFPFGWLAGICSDC
jgi:hypothetical protein